MGYTHNWQRPVELPVDQFGAAVTDFKDILASIGVALGGFNGSGSPVLNNDQIVFNGLSPAVCEPFEIARVEFDRHGRNPIRSFCKTQKLPYDLAVQVALIILAHHLGSLIAVGSDGKDDDWKAARRICEEKLGYGGQFKLEQSW